MRAISLIILVLLFFGCDTKKYTLVPHIKGKLYSKATNSPIQDVKIYNHKFRINAIDTLKTDKGGNFFIPNFIVKGYGKVKDFRPRISYTYYLSKDELHKIVDVEKYYKHKFHKADFHKKHTIDLGLIYFEDLEDFDYEELKREYENIK